MAPIIGVDVGGTFTDVVVMDDDGALAARKVPTTQDQSVGVASAVETWRGGTFLHGTTVATNTVLEESGAVVALITDAGYEDLVEIGRQDRPSLYDSDADRPRPLVARELRLGLEHEEGIDGLKSLLAGLGPEVVVVGLIESYADPGRERSVGSAVEAALDVPVLLSADVSPEFREYERLATTLLSAYLTPSVSSYLQSLDRRLDMAARSVMTSAGGLVPFAEAPRVAGRLVLSGPAGGAVAAAALGSHYGHDTVISFDMGGTSTDVSRITGGRLAVGGGHVVAGRVNRVPAIPIHTIGAGGGSIGWLDAGGALRVGPRSAGANPGPAAYGAGGTEPTVTDANVVIGHIPAHLRLGGSLELDVDAGIRAMEGLGESMGLPAHAVAEGMIEVVDSHMERALRVVTVEEGADPREAALIAFGGAGGLHASRLAKRLGMAKVLIPPHAGVFSALGLLLSVPRADLVRTVMLDDGDDRLAVLAGGVEEGARRHFFEMFGTEPTAIRRTADVRYVGQSHELEVGVSEDWAVLKTRFETEHWERFGFSRPGEGIEVVNLRATAEGKAPISWGQVRPARSGTEAESEGSVWRRASLPVGYCLDGPALVVEDNAAVLIEEGDRMTVLDDGTLEIVY